MIKQKILILLSLLIALLAKGNLTQKKGFDLVEIPINA